MDVLKMGSEGPYVFMLQLALRRAGFGAEPDGVFSLDTKNALSSFQKANHLNVQDYVTEETLSALSPFLLGYMLITAQRGDKFYKLANKYNVTYEAICAANPCIDPMNLRISSRVVIPLGFPVVPSNIPFCSSLLSYCLKGLKNRYPFISVGTIGKSAAGKPIFYLKIGSGENKVLYNAAHHANEWITAPLIMRFIEDYAKEIVINGRISGQDTSHLRRHCTLYAVPMLNPDGVDLVLGALPKTSIHYLQALKIAAAYPEISFPSGWKANIYGLDLNLQYPAGWKDAEEIKHRQGYIRPSPKNYCGESPLSAPESAALYRFSEKVLFNLTLSYHTQGREIYWKYLDREPPGSFEIAKCFAEQSGYTLSEAPPESASAGFKDWYIKRFNRPAFTIEAGYGENPLPLSQFDNIYSENFGIMALGLNAT